MTAVAAAGGVGVLVVLVAFWLAERRRAQETIREDHQRALGKEIERYAQGS